MKYLILGQLGGIGGWQLYIDARTAYMKDRGYDVYLISISDEKDIKLSRFINNKHFCLPEVHMPPASYTEKQRDSILARIYEFIGEDDGSMTIESTDMYLSMWGELIAKHYGARNYSYLLHSHFPQQNRYVQDFFLFKYNRDELAGMSELTLPELFNNHPDANKIEPKSLLATPMDPITDDNDIEAFTKELEEYKKKKAAFVIGYFGNLDKPHFIELCEFVENYVKTSKEHEFVFLSVGSSGKGNSEETQKKIESNTANCKVFNVPSMYPVPKKVFQIMDICLASWGSADISAKAGALTVRLLDDVTIIPQGILGLTITDYKSPRTSETLIEIFDKVRNDEYKVENAKIDKKPYDYVTSHKRIDKAIFNVIHDKDYYDISKIKTVSKRSEIEKMLNTTFGINITKHIMVVIKKVLAKPYARMQRKESYAK